MCTDHLKAYETFTPVLPHLRSSLVLVNSMTTQYSELFNRHKSILGKYQSVLQCINTCNRVFWAKITTCLVLTTTTFCVIHSCKSKEFSANWGFNGTTLRKFYFNRFPVNKQLRVMTEVKHLVFWCRYLNTNTLSQMSVPLIPWKKTRKIWEKQKRETVNKELNVLLPGDIQHYLFEAAPKYQEYYISV